MLSGKISGILKFSIWGFSWISGNFQVISSDFRKGVEEVKFIQYMKVKLPLDAIPA